MTRTVLLCAGGTGGHLFPAEALAVALAARGVAVDLATDARAAAFAGPFPARTLHAIPSETVRSRSPVALARTALTLASGFLASWRLIGRVHPDLVVGFGGYPTWPPLMAAARRGVPTMIHEQNAVIGRANKALAPRVSMIATGFPEVKGLETVAASRRRHVGNPVRPAVIEAARQAYPLNDGPIRLLVFGGSQGARVMSDVVPPAIARLEAPLRARITIVQQAREEDLERVRVAYAAAGVTAEIAPFFKDLPARMAAAHFVISRGGASTVAELAVIGRPSILVPLPGALDQDQAANARALAAAGGAIVMDQSGFTPETLAVALSSRLADWSSLETMAARARAVGIADAADRLADLAIELIAARASGTRAGG